MRILILGGDGYLGWSTALHLSASGYDVVIVDNFWKRNTLRELNRPDLFQVEPIETRIDVWRTHSGKSIDLRVGDVCDQSFLSSVVREFVPDAIVHYAEQPSAPYSMLGYTEAEYTLRNNLLSTLSLVYAVRDEAPETHIIKLGTMGEYGTPNIPIEEGFLEIEHKGRKDKFLFPRQGGSLYHTTKIQDTDLLYFYVRNWGLRATDLMQGPVYGFETIESAFDSKLATFFCYDDLFGTVLNRFLVQAVVGQPLTVFGKGLQTRGYLNIVDTVQCIRLAIENPSRDGELRVFNQFTETLTVNQIAELVRSAGEALGLKVSIDHLENPRLEKEEHFYQVENTNLLDLGLDPKLLSENVVITMLQKVMVQASNIRPQIIMPTAQWTK